MNDRLPTASPASGPDDAFYDLIACYLDGQVTTDELARIERDLTDNPRRRDIFLDVCMQATLIAEAGVAPHKPFAPGLPQAAFPNPNRPTSPVLGFLHTMLHISGDTPFVAAVMWLVMFVCTGMVLTLFVGIYIMVHDGAARIDAPQVVQAPAIPPPAPQPIFSTVARLIGTAECVWGDDGPQLRAPQLGDDLAPGRKLELKSGLAKFMFQSGATAVLQGPASLEIGSRTSAFLRRGKFNVTCEDSSSHGFLVETPGMKIVDLGTEFGVSVAKNGSQEVHVFRGSVQAEAVKEIRAHDSNPQSPIPNPLPAPFVLSAHQAIRWTNLGKPPERFAADEKQFFRAIPAPEPFPLFGTGVGLAVGAADPHWSIVKISTDAKFQPQAAVLSDPFDGYAHGETQWISNAKERQIFPGGCRWTFRTQFDLTGFDPSTARIDGKFSVDDYLADIRVNGKIVPLPVDARSNDLLTRWTELKIDQGFVAGENSLEIVIENKPDWAPNCGNVMALNVDWKGTARKILKFKAGN